MTTCLLISLADPGGGAPIGRGHMIFMRQTLNQIFLFFRARFARDTL